MTFDLDNELNTMTEEQQLEIIKGDWTEIFNLDNLRIKCG